MFDDPDAKPIMTLMVLAVIGLLFMTLLPWLSYTHEDKEESSWFEYDGDYTYYYTDAHIHIVADQSMVPSEFEDIGDTLWMMTALFWLALVLSIVSLIGILASRLGYGSGIAWVGAGIPVIAIVILILGVLVLVQISDLDDEFGQDDEYSSSHWHFGGNFVPFLVAILMIPTGLKHIRSIRRRLGPPGYPGYPGY